MMLVPCARPMPPNVQPSLGPYFASLTPSANVAHVCSPCLHTKRDDAENAKAKAILSPSLGMLQVIAQLAPVFRTKTPTTDKPCHSGDDPSHDAVDQKGDVGLSTAVSGKEFLWVFDERKEGGTTISAPAPAELGFPAGGRVYLVWELPNVKWEFSGGIVEDIPSNATWSLSPFDGGGKSCSGADDKARAKSVAPAT